MAKKAKKQNKKAKANELPENMLPQNILPIGERVEENKNIYISQVVYKEIHKFTKNKTTNESGGMLVGSIIEEFGKTHIIISGFVEAKFCDATPTTLKFTHETWEYVHKEIEKKHKGKKIVGWIHTHPDFGIFLSEYDKFIQQNFFNEDYQVAYVVDPIQNLEGYYFWINGAIERCKGFYIYDKTGVRITVGIDNGEAVEAKDELSLFGIKQILNASIAIAMVVLLAFYIATSNKLAKIEQQQKTLANTATMALAQMQQTISVQADEIQTLRNVLIEAGIIEEPEFAVVPDENASSGSEIIQQETGEPTGSAEDKTA